VLDVTQTDRDRQPFTARARAVGIVVFLMSSMVACTSGVGPSSNAGGSSQYELAGRLIGAAVFTFGFYLAGVWVVAWLRDPLRGRNRAPVSVLASESDGSVVDLTAAASAQRGAAASRLRFQLLGLALASPALVPFMWPDIWPLAVIGLVIGVGVPWWMGRGRRGAGVRRAETTAVGRSIVAVGLYVAASGAFLLGILSFVVYAAGSANPVRTTGTISRETLQALTLLIGVIALAIGSALWFVAQRLASVRARELMRRDSRPPVLYLRSFGDDRLKIRIAAFGRAAFIERLSPRRFAPFEQIVARHLWEVGPVIAVNRPGTRLPPLGAARVSLSDEEWQKEVDQWIERASWIVLGAAPGRVSTGFAWELDLVASRSLWSKAILVLPPVPDADVRERWHVFEEALAQSEPVPSIPVDPAAALTLRRGPDGAWIAYVADRRDEWCYAGALRSAVEGPA
jgi:hypothetical protein